MFGTPSSFLYGAGRSVNVAYIRLVGVLPDASHIFVIPGYMEPWRRPSRACLRRMSPRHRRDLLRLIAQQKRRPDLNVVTVDDDGHGFTGHSVTVGDIKSGATTAIIPSVFRPHTTIDGLVPDGVAGVAVDGPGGTHAGATVADNFFVAELPISVGPKDHLTVTWLAGDGGVVKTITYPPGPHSVGGGSFSGGSSGVTVPTDG